MNLIEFVTSTTVIIYTIMMLTTCTDTLLITYLLCNRKIFAHILISVMKLNLKQKYVRVKNFPPSLLMLMNIIPLKISSHSLHYLVGRKN